MATIDDDARDGITRRDFLDGVAITAAGLAAAAAAPFLTGAEAALAGGDDDRRPHGQPPGLPPGYDPDIVAGLKGTPDALVARTMAVDGPPNPDDVHSTRGGPGVRVRRVVNTHEEYDCVIVGAGASGLAAAKFYRDRFGENARILLLDAMEDYGGHSARNRFDVPTAGGGTLSLIRNAGTVNLDSVGTWNQPTGGLLDIPGSYGQPALDLLDYCGVDIDAFPDNVTSSIPSSFGLRPMLLFPSEDWGADTLARNRNEPNTPAGWTAFVDRLPFSPEAKAAIVRIQTDTTTDWIAAKHGPLSEAARRDLLTRITYKQYLMDYLGAPEEAVLQYQRNSHGLLGAGVQAVSAADMWLLGQPGFDGVGLGDPVAAAFPGVGRTPQMGAKAVIDPTLFWPDGNASLLRLLVSKLIPAAVPDVAGDRPNQETVVLAKVDYGQLDRPENAVRLRLNSVVYEVKPGNPRSGGGGQRADVFYAVGNTGYRVRGRHVVMACWNRVTARVVKGLPRHQVEDLCYARKVPLIYGRAALRNWRAFADAKIASVTPRGNSLFWDTTSLNAGASFGSVYGPNPADPDSPALISFTVVPSDPNRTPQLAAYEAGRQRLLEMSFGELEGALWDVLDRSVNVSGGDFDPGRDVESLMMNRWNYGYAHEFTSVWDPSLYGPDADQPHVRGRVPFKNVSIANSDAGAFAYTHSAISEGYRAVNDLPA
jgi:spermidine dehydrogenase